MTLGSSFALILGQMSPSSFHVDPGDLVAMIVIPSLCLMVGWLGWLLTRTRHLRVKAHVEMHNRLVAQVNSSQDLVQLVQSEEGRRLLEALNETRPGALEEILRTVQTGIIFSVVGCGSVVLRLLFPVGYGLFIAAGVLLGIVGVGLLVSAAVVYRLSTSWRLIWRGPSRRVDDAMPNKSLFGG